MDGFSLLESGPENGNKNTFEFNSTSLPPTVRELDEIQNMLIYLIVNIKFRKHPNGLQKKLKDDIQEIMKEKEKYIL